MSFTYLLVIFAFLVFVLSVLMMRLVGRSKKTSSETSPRAEWLFNIYTVAAGVFFVLSSFYIIIGQRDLSWFFIFALFGLLSVYFAGSSKAKHRNFAIIVVIALVVFQSVFPILENRGIIFGPDQWRDLRVTEYITETGTFNNYPGFETGFYSFIPFFNVLNAVFSEIVAWPTMMTFVVMQAVLCLISALAIYVIMMKLTNNASFSVVAVLLFVSIPRLTLIQAVPSRVSISLGLILVMLFLKGSLKQIGRTSIVALMSMLALAIAMIHPVGVLPILCICFGVVVLGWILNRERLSIREISFTRTCFILCLFVPLIYWTIDSRVFSGVFNPFVRFLNVITRFQSGASIYNPQYLEAGFELSSFAWALPVGLSAAFIAYILISKQKGKPWLSRDLRQHFITICSLFGVFLILLTFLSVVIAPGAALERYVNIVGYALLLVPSAFVLSVFFSSGKKVGVIFGTLLLLTTLVAGSSSPDWAPFENPSFGATRFTYSSYVESETLVYLLPNNTRLYEDHDIFLSSYASLRNIVFITDDSYQTTRNVIQDFQNGSFTPFEPKYMNTIILLKNDEVVDQNLFSKYLNIYYNSGRHIMVSLP